MRISNLVDSGGFSILCYHGVCSDDTDFGELNSSGKHTIASRFDEQMAYLAKNHKLITMSDIAESFLNRFTIPEGAVAVTFDDGFANNVTHAWPILEKYGVPATFYLATGYIGRERVMRMDTIEAIVFLSGLESLKLNVGSESLLFSLDSSVSRKQAFQQLKSLCKSLPKEQAEKMVVDLVSQVPDTEIFSRPEYSFMTWDDARRMSRSELVELGAHTVDHFPLSTLDDDQVEYQIRASVERIESELDQRCVHFAYPEGRLCDYDERAVSLLAELGIGIAPNAVSGANSCDSIDPYHLNRFLVGMDNNEVFVV